MVLVVHSNTSYLTEHNSRSRDRDHFFMSNHEANLPNNKTVLNILSTHYWKFMTSVEKPELGTLFIKSRQAIPTRTTVEEMGHTKSTNRPKPKYQHHRTVICDKEPAAQGHKVHQHAALVRERPPKPETAFR